MGRHFVVFPSSFPLAHSFYLVDSIVYARILFAVFSPTLFLAVTSYTEKEEHECVSMLPFVHLYGDVKWGWFGRRRKKDESGFRIVLVVVASRFVISFFFFLRELHACTGWRYTTLPCTRFFSSLCSSRLVQIPTQRRASTQGDFWTGVCTRCERDKQRPSLSYVCVCILRVYRCVTNSVPTYITVVP